MIVYGNSLIMAGIAASLTKDANLDVLRIDPQGPNSRKQLETLYPATIVFDLSNLPPDLDLALLCGRPELQLLGVDPANDLALVLSGHLTEVLTGQELIRLVQKKGDRPQTISRIREMIEGGEIEDNHEDVDATK